jgi:hypothetical protein
MLANAYQQDPFPTVTCVEAQGCQKRITVEEKSVICLRKAEMLLQVCTSTVPFVHRLWAGCTTSRALAASLLTEDVPPA